MGKAWVRRRMGRGVEIVVVCMGGKVVGGAMGGLHGHAYILWWAPGVWGRHGFESSFCSVVFFWFSCVEARFLDCRSVTFV